MGGAYIAGRRGTLKRIGRGMLLELSWEGGGGGRRGVILLGNTGRGQRRQRVGVGVEGGECGVAVCAVCCVCCSVASGFLIIRTCMCVCEFASVCCATFL